MENIVYDAMPRPCADRIPEWFLNLGQTYDAKVRDINQLLTPIDDAHCIRISARVRSPNGRRFETISICKMPVDINHLDQKIYNAIRRSNLNAYTLAAIAIILRDNPELFSNLRSIEGINTFVIITNVEGSNIVLFDPKIESVLQSSIERYV